MATTGELLLLQGKCKTDPESYYDDFHQRFRHYKSLLVRPRGRRVFTRTAAADAAPCCAPCAQAIFSLSPSAEYKEFSDLVYFLAQARPS